MQFSLYLFSLNSDLLEYVSSYLHTGQEKVIEFLTLISSQTAYYCVFYQLMCDELIHYSQPPLFLLVSLFPVLYSLLNNLNISFDLGSAYYSSSWTIKTVYGCSVIFSKAHLILFYRSQFTYFLCIFFFITLNILLKMITFV